MCLRVGCAPQSLADSLDNAVVKDNPYFNKLLRILTTRCMEQAVYFGSGDLCEADYRHYGLAAPLCVPKMGGCCAALWSPPLCCSLPPPPSAPHTAHPISREPAPTPPQPRPNPAPPCLNVGTPTSRPPFDDTRT